MEALETVCRDFLEVTECELQSQRIVDLERQQRMQQTAQQALQIVVVVTASSTTLKNGTEEEFYSEMFEQSGDVFVQDLSQADPFFAPLVGVLLLLVDGTPTTPLAAPSTTNAPTTLTNAPITRAPAINASPPPPSTNAPTRLAGVVIIPVPSRTTAPTTGPCRVCRDPGEEVGNPEGMITIGGNSTTCGRLQMAIIPDDQCFQVQAFAGLTCECRPVVMGPTTAPPSPSPVMAGLPTAIDPAWTEVQSTIESLLGGPLSDPSFGPYLQAFNWLQNEDPLQLTPSSSDDLFLQRFFTVYLYFATTVNGPWPFCNPPNTFLNEDDLCVYEKRVHSEAQPVEIPWVRFLTNRTECQWVGVFCDDFGFVNALDFSK